MYKLDLQPDLLQEQALRRKRRLDNERRVRIFDPMVRKFGIDVHALEEQIKIKNGLKAIEKERERTCDKISLETNKLLQHLDQKVNETRRANEKTLNEYRLSNQQSNARREFDLNDPQMLKKMTPSRMTDDDPNCSVSGSQKFEGEDLAEKDRLKLQKEQMRLWTLQKLCEMEAKSNEEKEIERQREEYNQALAARIRDLMIADDRHRKSIAHNDTEINLKLAFEKQLREKLEKESEQEQNMREINGLIEGDFLTERSAPTQPNSHKIRVDAFKGMTYAQRQEILKIQEQQRREGESRKVKAKEEERAWAGQQYWGSRAALLLEREKERHRKNAAKKLMEENVKQAKEFKERQSYMNSVLYTNEPTDAYFAQFNTSSR